MDQEIIKKILDCAEMDRLTLKIKGKEDTKYYQTWDLFYQWLEGCCIDQEHVCSSCLTNYYKLYPGGTMLNQYGWIYIIKRKLKKNTQQRGRTNLWKEIVPEERSHRREGPISCFFLLGLPQHQAPQPHLLIRLGDTGRFWWDCTIFQKNYGVLFLNTVYIQIYSLTEMSHRQILKVRSFWKTNSCI